MDSYERYTQSKAERLRRRRRRKLALLAILLAAVLVAAALIIRSKIKPTSSTPETTPVSTVQTQESTTAPTATEETETLSTTQQPEDPDSWKLMLINPEHPLPSDYVPTLKQLRNSQQVDERIYPELQQMFDDAREAGYAPLINESYRSAERQQDILDKRTAENEQEGLSHEEALKKALETVSPVGASEHQAGLAVDITTEDGSEPEALWQWLLDHSFEYGFILRYPQGKESITGITYEPWHFRYVGAEAAKEIHDRQITLEEYLQS